MKKDLFSNRDDHWITGLTLFLYGIHNVAGWKYTLYILHILTAMFLNMLRSEEAVGSPSTLILTRKCLTVEVQLALGCVQSHTAVCGFAAVSRLNDLFPQHGVKRCAMACDLYVFSHLAVDETEMLLNQLQHGHKACHIKKGSGTDQTRSCTSASAAVCYTPLWHWKTCYWQVF